MLTFLQIETPFLNLRPHSAGHLLSRMDSFASRFQTIRARGSSRSVSTNSGPAEGPAAVLLTTLAELLWRAAAAAWRRRGCAARCRTAWCARPWIARGRGSGITGSRVARICSGVRFCVVGCSAGIRRAGTLWSGFGSTTRLRSRTSGRRRSSAARRRRGAAGRSCGSAGGGG